METSHTYAEKDLAVILAQAKEGDLAASKVLLNYAIGGPAQPVDPEQDRGGVRDQRQDERYVRKAGVVMTTADNDAVFSIFDDRRTVYMDASRLAAKLHRHAAAIDQENVRQVLSVNPLTITPVQARVH